MKLLKNYLYEITQKLTWHYFIIKVAYSIIIFLHAMYKPNIFYKETFCYGDVLFRRRYVTETFCCGDLLYGDIFFKETFRVETFYMFASR
jgi:hypothetical protein